VSGIDVGRLIMASMQLLHVTSRHFIMASQGSTKDS